MREIIKLKPAECVTVFGTLILNQHKHKPMYVRLGRKSVTVSDRKPAAYGVKKRA